MVELIATEKELADSLAFIAESELIGIDTEFDRRTTYFPILSLLQINCGREIFVIDLLTNKLELRAFSSIWNNPACKKVMHAGSQDIALLNHLTGSRAVNIFDTQIATQLLRMSQQISYEELVAKIVYLPLEKNEQKSDWLRRPLLTSQLNYAANDVAHLLEIYPRLAEQLIAQGRLEWCKEIFEQLAHSQLEKTPEKVWLKFASPYLSLDNLAKIKALCLWREEAAKNLNIPVSHLLDNKYLFEIAALKDMSFESIFNIINVPQVTRPLAMRNLSNQARERGGGQHRIKLAMNKSKAGESIATALREKACGERFTEEIMGVVETADAADLTPTELHYAEMIKISNQKYDQLKRLKALLAERASEVHTVPTVIANREDLQEFLWLKSLGREQESKLMQDWRYEVFGRYTTEAILL